MDHSSSHSTLDLTLISAQDLKDVNLLSRLEVYAAAALSSDPRTRQRTETDRTGLKNPTWNSTLRFSIPADAAQRGVNLVVTLHAERTLGDRLVGEVRIPIKELLADSASTSTVRRVSYQVRRPSGKPKGILNLSYKFSDAGSYYPSSSASYPTTAATTTYPPKTKMDAPADEPVTAYPVYPPYPSTGAAYPPPASTTAGSASAYQAPTPPVGYPKYNQQQAASQAYGGYGYSAAPTPAAYGSYPTAYGGGYAAQPAKPPKKNKFGMGLGAGLLGGALGGLLIGDVIGDAVSYDGGYDAGFGDGFGDFGF